MAVVLVPWLEATIAVLQSSVMAWCLAIVTAASQQLVLGISPVVTSLLSFMLDLLVTAQRVYAFCVTIS